MDTNNEKLILTTDQGFSIIEALIAISIFAIGFMALSTTIWSASKTTRTSAYADMSVMAAQDMVEMLSIIPIDHNSLDVGTYEIKRYDETIEIDWEILNATDPDGDGTPDYKTIAIQVSGEDKLRMQGYYRRQIN